MNRKNFVKLAGFGAAVATSAGITAFDNSNAITTSEKPVTKAIAGGKAEKAFYVPNGKDRFQDELLIWGIIPLQIKVSSKDTVGSLFVFEHANMPKGGPPMHFHYEQDEWFYAMEGEFSFVVGDEKFMLRPGDSLFAPRMIPHAWAYIGDKPGTLLLAVQPAGSLEEFFMKCCDMTRPPTPEEADKLFAAHGMKVVGPPLNTN